MIEGRTQLDHMIEASEGTSPESSSSCATALACLLASEARKGVTGWGEQVGKASGEWRPGGVAGPVRGHTYRFGKPFKIAATGPRELV